MMSDSEEDAIEVAKHTLPNKKILTVKLHKEVRDPHSGRAYKLIKTLGRGEYGRVYRAEIVGGAQPRDPPVVALKAYFAERVENDDGDMEWNMDEPEEEAAITNYLNRFQIPHLLRTLGRPFSVPNPDHQKYPNVVAPTVVYTAMELYDGPDLLRFLKLMRSTASQADMAQQEHNSNLLLTMMEQASEAVEGMQKVCIAHADLKPSNMIVDPAQNQLTVVDLGMACFMPTCRTQQQQPQNIPRCPYGKATTPGYNPPESFYARAAEEEKEQNQLRIVLRNKMQKFVQLDQHYYNYCAYDVFSLGQVFREMATGDLTLYWSDKATKRHALASATPQDKRAMTGSPELNALLTRMLEPDWTKRPSISEVRATLQNIKLKAPLVITRAPATVVAELGKRPLEVSSRGPPKRVKSELHATLPGGGILGVPPEKS